MILVFMRNLNAFWMSNSAYLDLQEVPNGNRSRTSP